METLQRLTMLAAIVFTLLGGGLGLLGVWVADFWKNSVGPKLVLTSFILAGTSAVVAAITHWLR